jgi:hypothetical protein
MQTIRVRQVQPRRGVSVEVTWPGDQELQRSELSRLPIDVTDARTVDEAHARSRRAVTRIARPDARASEVPLVRRE